jgi:signal transduction histidine kinase
MLRTLLGAVAAVALTLSASTIALAQAGGTAAEAKAMLEKAVAAVKADKDKSIAMFKSGEGGFKDRDLYPFCFNVADGIIIAAPPTVLGKDIRTLKDPTGKGFGADIFNAAKDGTFTEVSYMFPKPGDTTPVPKVSFVTKIGDVGCGVGYYK